MAVLAEVEREIFLGMEALEDAFEVLHQRAEAVRAALRARGAALSLSIQQRRGAAGGGTGMIDVLPPLSGDSSASSGYQRPAWAAGIEIVKGGDDDRDPGTASESDWGCDDFDIAPEDSASNISSSRKRRPRRRDERRTPAPIAEEGSDY